MQCSGMQGIYDRLTRGFILPLSLYIYMDNIYIYIIYTYAV